MRPESWKTATKPEAAGEVLFVPSAPDLSNVEAATAMDSEAKHSASMLIIARAVLIIRQTRAAHDEIQEVIWRVESGDAETMGGGISAAGGMGGGFGGGFLSPPGQ